MGKISSIIFVNTSCFIAYFWFSRRCIGSTQHLKNLYGAGYTLEVKINSDDRAASEKEEMIKQFVNDVFPLATLEETFSDHLIFSIPQSSVKSLAHCFSKIESGNCSVFISYLTFFIFLTLQLQFSC